MTYRITIAAATMLVTPSIAQADTCEKTLGLHGFQDGRMTCTPSRSGDRMRISVPEMMVVHSPQQFEFKGKQYALCRKMVY